MKTAAITFDIDWAPDWCVALCRDICLAHGIPATFFATHPSAELSRLLSDDRFEVGIHPNLLPNSSHGATTEDVLRYCLDLVPSARSMRTHALVQSTGLFQTVLRAAPSIRFDVSLFLPSHAGLTPTRFYVGEDRPIIRIPYYWEDDVASMTPGWSWDSDPLPSDGLQIFDFHPIHVALNMATMRQYTDLKNTIGQSRMDLLSESDVEPFVNSACGTRTFLERAIARIGAARFDTIAALSESYLAERRP